MGINNPVPRDLGQESKKAAKILTSFVKPNQIVNYDEVIPPHVLRNAKGLAILTVLKAGFLFSGRAGSGVIVARLPDGTWSPPSAIMTAGAGAGGMIGAELTDFIFVLNSRDAVKAFSSFGTLTLGGNVSVAAGPLGRSGEAAGAAGTGAVAAIFSYAKTKGLYAGVSLEGSAIVERKDANAKFYGRTVTAQAILSGRVRAPRSVSPLFRVLDSRAFRSDYSDDWNVEDVYDDIPDEIDSVYSSRSRNTMARSSGRYVDDDDDYDDDRYNDGYRSDEDDYDRRRGGGAGGAGGNSRSAYPPSNRRSSRYSDDYSDDDSYGAPRRQPSTRRNYTDEYSRSSPRSARRDYDDYDDRPRDRDRGDRDRGDYDSRRGDRDRGDRDRDRDRYGSSRRDRDRDYDSRRGEKSPMSPSSQTRPAAAAASDGMHAIALYSFAGEESGDLSFRKGDAIKIVAKSDSSDDWWTGEVNGRTGIFPANYVELA